MGVINDMTEDLAMKQRPQAFCTTCGYVLYDASQAVGLCPKCFRRKRRGTFELVLNPNDWTVCPACRGEGVHEDDVCQHCVGLGWLLFREGNKIRCWESDGRGC